MVTEYKTIIIGAGMMGSAAARHLASMDSGVALIGPAEPEVKSAHNGVFASHYDEARITRTIDSDPNWATFANRSIARYGEIARESGIDFYHEVGCLIWGVESGAGAGYVKGALDAATRLGAKVEHLDHEGLQSRFPYFHLPREAQGVWEAKGAGHINPRRLVAAQCRLAEKNGAVVIREEVSEVKDEGGAVRVLTSKGKSYTAEKVLVAAGGFQNANRLMPRPLDLKVYGRTVQFFELGPEEADRLVDMPSVIGKPYSEHEFYYVLPPVRYPDGRVYIKIGGEPDDLLLSDEKALKAWFRGDGRESARQHLTRIMCNLIPSLKAQSSHSAACVTSFTPTGCPAIAFTSSPRIAVLTGGAGAAAKSSDEIGRLGAELIFTGRIQDHAYTTDFRADFL
ncbi:NAD(P)/FAD-dependent oxidoreductase [Rhizobium sp. NRK18]|uniref:NAD(P)/FAD-dependent oxidoreductase n=1 Tax=Rhizobium sp. NRK18 TaxID=2964667 RepID=UPI0021C34BE1|nr:FAD-binding oxidoreductase [Rhizobium sp. NRK18]MCQ2003746.1 FAD-binding oxidoreductase [Rhizobium sp. NRK18]